MIEFTVLTHVNKKKSHYAIVRVQINTRKLRTVE